MVSELAKLPDFTGRGAALRVDDYIDKIDVAAMSIRELIGSVGEREDSVMALGHTQETHRCAVATFGMVDHSGHLTSSCAPWLSGLHDPASCTQQPKMHTPEQPAEGASVHLPCAVSPPL